MADPMPISRISAQVTGGAVVITVDPRTAVTIGEAFAEWHRDRPIAADRPSWAGEVDDLIAVAVRAAKAESTRVDVPLLSAARGDLG